MRTTKAQRIRFGVLAARHQLERARLTDWQVDYLEGCEAAGWRVRDSKEAYKWEWSAAIDRVLNSEERPHG